MYIIGTIRREYTSIYTNYTSTQNKLDNLILQKYLIGRPNHSTISLTLTTNEVVHPKGAGDNRKKTELASILLHSPTPLSFVHVSPVGNTFPVACPAVRRSRMTDRKEHPGAGNKAKLREKDEDRKKERKPMEKQAGKGEKEDIGVE